MYVHVQNYSVHYIESHMTRHVTNSAESAEKIATVHDGFTIYVRKFIKKYISLSEHQEI